MDVTRRLWRRWGWLLTVGCGIGIATGASMACVASSPSAATVSSEQAEGRLRARPAVSLSRSKSPSTSSPLTPGEQRLAIGTDRDGLLFVPRDVAADRALPLLVLLHGATGSAQRMASRIDALELANQFKMIVLIPDSRERTWDIVRGGFGPDVAFLDTALERLFARVAIDPKRVAISGFSDGASYALSLGLINGDLFTHVIAFSPGFFVADHRTGHPVIFISHGTHDEILPIETTSRRLVPALREAGYAVQFREFDGPHTVPTTLAREAFTWMLGASTPVETGGAR